MKNTTIEELYSIYLKYNQIVKDTRLVVPGCIFWALKGERFDGNEFAEEALNKGASFAVIDRPELKKDDRFILVEDSLLALQNLARNHRDKLKIPVLGITGSNGKTSTKELINSVLSQGFKTFATPGNYNNHIGVPLSILSIREDCEIAIIEMGANHQKEIEFLCSISKPSHGLITNIGKAHLEGFGGIEGVKKGKSELYRFLETVDGLAFVNGDDPVLLELLGSLPSLKYGKKLSHYCSGELNSSHPNLKGTWLCNKQKGVIHSGLYGEYNFYNILAAIAIGNYFKLNSGAIDRGVEMYQSENNRSQLILFNDAKVYLDAYNANPSSMEAAIVNFSKNDNPKKIVLLGDMFELGVEEATEHKKIIDLSLSKEFEKHIFVGKRFSLFKGNYPTAKFFPSTEEAKVYFEHLEIANYDILIKGSRGMALEKVLQ